MTTAKDILAEAADMLDARASGRDKPDGERSMGKIVSCFNTATGHRLSERDGWLFMVFLKAVRAATTPHGKPDDYVDGSAYFALTGEAASTPIHNTYTLVEALRAPFIDAHGVPDGNDKLATIDKQAHAKFKGGAV